MLDQSAIEFYKLAAGIIPLLWIGTVLQRLDPSPLQSELRQLDEQTRQLRAEAERLRADSEEILKKILLEQVAR